MSFGGQTPTIIVLKEGQSTADHAAEIYADGFWDRHGFFAGKGTDYLEY
jgi:hypothetical protein